MTSLRKFLPFVITLTCFALFIAPVVADDPSLNPNEKLSSLSDVQANAETQGIETIANIGKSFVNHTADIIETEDTIYNATHPIIMKQLAPVGHAIVKVKEFVVPKSTKGKVIGGTGVGAVVAANGFNIYASNAFSAALGEVAIYPYYKRLIRWYGHASSPAFAKAYSAESVSVTASNIANPVNYIAGYGALLYCGYRYCDKSTELIQDAYVKHGVEFDHTLLNW